jgi:hypothetical protein
MHRLEQQRKMHAVVVKATVAAFALGIGWTLPRNPVGAGIVLGAAVLSLVVVWLRAESRAPSHGLRHVVRLPAVVALTAKVDALRARVAGTARALWTRASRREPVAEGEAADWPRHYDYAGAETPTEAA